MTRWFRDRSEAVPPADAARRPETPRAGPAAEADPAARRQERAALALAVVGLVAGALVVVAFFLGVGGERGGAPGARSVPEADPRLAPVYGPVLLGWIDRAEQAMARAWETGETEGLGAFYAGDELRARKRAVAAARASGEYREERRLARTGVEVRVAADSSWAVVASRESRGVATRRVDGGACLSRALRRDIPRTVRLERGGAGWRITRVDFPGARVARERC